MEFIYYRKSQQLPWKRHLDNALSIDLVSCVLVLNAMQQGHSQYWPHYNARSVTTFTMHEVLQHLPWHLSER